VPVNKQIVLNVQLLHLKLKLIGCILEHKSLLLTLTGQNGGMLYIYVYVHVFVYTCISVYS
jgi:hypothetical protein